MSDLSIGFKKLDNEARMPTRGSIYAAGWDLYADIPSGFVWIKPHETVKISTGLSIAIPNGWEGEIRPRSGLATKQGLRPANTPGTIDSDYRGPVIVALHNDSEETQRIDTGERIAQILFNKVPDVHWIEVPELDETARGEGGFGSTGSK